MAIPEEIQEKVLAEATSATPNFSVDMNDPQFQQVKDEYAADAKDLEGTYNGIINKTDKFYEDLSGAYQQQADKLAQIQQENTDFAIEQIEQQKDQAHKDYIKEQSGAYVDWQKQSNAYGVNAEKMAANGLTDSGYSESSQVAMYNQYQNRVATAKESLDRAMLNYNNGIKEAMLQNNAAIAEIYANLFVKQAEIALEGFQYGNTLVLELADKKQTLKDNAWQKQMQILQHLQSEKQLEADIWQHQDTQKWQTEQNQLDREWQEHMAEVNNNYQLERDRINNEFAEKLEGVKHDYNIKYLNAKTEKDKELAEIEFTNKKKELEIEQANALARIEKEYDEKVKAEKAIIEAQKVAIGQQTTKNSTAYKNAKNEHIAYKQTTTPVTKSVSGYSGTNTSEAIAYAKKNGVPSNMASSIWSISEWSRRKNSTSNNVAKGTTSYADYLNKYTKYLIETYAK